jgi:NADH:ubiquinone oxidoreductase subunit E
MSEYKIHLLVCGGTGCKASESARVVDNLKHEISNQGLDDFAQVITTGCFGFCEKGPIVKIMSILLKDVKFSACCI